MECLAGSSPMRETWLSATEERCVGKDAWVLAAHRHSVTSFLCMTSLGSVTLCPSTLLVYIDGGRIGRSGEGGGAQVLH